MVVFAAGQIPTADELSLPPAVSDRESADITGFTDTTYAQGSPVCGVAFTAPNSGQVKVTWGARFESNSATSYVSAAVRTGGIIGSGSSVSAADDSFALESVAGTFVIRVQASRDRLVSGLTPGATYNAVTEHRTTGNGDIFDRDIMVEPLP